MHFPKFILQIVVLSGIMKFSSSSVIGKGKRHRALRSLANSMKSDKSIVILQCDDSPSSSFVKNLAETIAARELVNIRIDVEKKKTAKLVGEKLASDTGSMLAQVLGHTVLLYKESNPPGPITEKYLKLLTTDKTED